MPKKSPKVLFIIANTVYCTLRAKKLLHHYKKGQRRLIRAMLAIVDKVTSGSNADTFSIAHDQHNKLEKLDCYVEAVKNFRIHCPRHRSHDYFTAVSYIFVNLCNAGFDPMRIVEATEEVCSD